MKRMPTDDDAYGPGACARTGARSTRRHLYEVKRPEESRHPGDVYKLTTTIPAEQAFRPLAEGGCPLVRS
jgi:branched-chain amino acid transport system substrate-binding protein